MTAVYRPHSAQTEPHYERLLLLIKRVAPFGIEEGLAAVADDVLRIGRGLGVSDVDKVRGLRELFGDAATVGDDAARRILDVCAEITDYVVHGADGAEVDDGLDELSVEEGDDDNTAAHVAQFDFSDDDDAAPEAEDKGLALDAVTADYFRWHLRELMPQVPPDELPELSEYVVATLADEAEPDALVATQLMMRLDGYTAPEVEAWIDRVVAARWVCVYGTRLAAGEDRDAVVAACAEHMARDSDSQTVAAAYAALTGRPAAGGRRPVAQDEDGTVRLRTADELRLLDLDALKPEENGRAALAKHKTVVPPGTTRHAYEAFEEIVIPPQPRYAGNVALIPREQFPEWSQETFPAQVKALNPMQSTVYPAAFGSDENLLVCAPTGAGKTNVAMMTILRVLSQFRDEARGTFHHDLFKMVYVSPMKALVQEVVRTFSERLAPLGISVAELSGDSALSKAQLDTVQLIVTTPEKWDIVTRKSMDMGVASVVRLIIIDEVHLLHSERGAVLEAIVARTLRQVERTWEPVRLVGLSATLPNYKDVAQFLRVDSGKGLFHFDASFRPVPLKQTFCGLRKTKGRAAQAVAGLNDVCYVKTMEHAEAGAQVLIFVHGRKDTVATAQFVRRRAEKEGKDLLFVRPGSQAQEELREAALLAHNKQLRDLLPLGFGFHNAGLDKEDRAMVERLYGQRYLKVLVSTATLAWGVNLPAHAVIIKGTKLFAPDRGGWDDLSALDVFQMFGRAGRPGFDTFGEAVIITQGEDLEYYLSLLNQQLPIESQLVAKLVDALNAEVSLGTVKSRDDAVAWMECTYLATRMRRAPRVYGVTRAMLDQDKTLCDRVEDLAHSALAHLGDRKLVAYDAHSGAVQGTDLGRVASHFHLTVGSVATYSRLLSAHTDDVDLFRVFSMSDEFSRIGVRSDEAAEVRRLCGCCPVPVRDEPTKGAAKINVLLQAYIAQLPLEGFTLQSEMAYIKDNALRIAKALHEVAVVRGWAATSRKALELYHQVARRQWAVQSPLRQFGDALPPELIHRVENRRLDWDAMYYLEVDRGDFASYAPNDADTQQLCFDYVHRVPRLDIVALTPTPVTRSQLKLEMTVVPDFEYVEGVHERVLAFHVTVEDADGQRLLHHEVLDLNRDALLERRPVSTVCTVRVLDPKPTHYFVRVHCAGWIGSEVMAPVDLLAVALPDPAPPATTVSDEAFDVDAIGDASLEQAFFARRFDTFTPQQSAAAPTLLQTDESAIVGAAPGTGKTVFAELFMGRFLLSRALPALKAGDASPLLVFVTPERAQARRRAVEWSTALQHWALHCGVLEEGAAAPAYAALLSDPADVDSLASRVSGSVCVVVATVDAWRAVQQRQAEAAEVTGRVTDYVLDGVHRLSDVRTSATDGACTGLGGVQYEFLIASIAGPHRAAQQAINKRAKLEEAGAPVPDALLDAALPYRMLCLLPPSQHVQVLAEWVGVRSSALFNFVARSRRILDIEPVPTPGFRNRQRHMEHQLLALLETERYLARKVVVFFPSLAAARGFATTLYDQYRKVELPAANCGTEAFALQLAAGVAVLHAGTHPADHRALQQRVASGAPVIVAAPLEYAYSVGARDFDSVLVCGAQLVDAAPAQQGRPSDAALHLVLHAVSRAVYDAKLLCTPERVDFWRSFLQGAVPVLSCVSASLQPMLCKYVKDSDPALAEEGEEGEDEERPEMSTAMQRAVADQLAPVVNAWVAGKQCGSMQDLMRLLPTLYLARCLQRTPSTYGLPNATAEARTEFLSGVADAVVAVLEGAHCATMEAETMQLRPTIFGVTAARNALPPDTVSALLALPEAATPRDIVAALAAIPHLAARVTLRPGEPQVLARLGGALPSRLLPPRVDYGTVPTKIAVLLVAFMLRRGHAVRTLSPETHEDMNAVVRTVAELCPGVAEVLVRLSWPLALSVMRLAQALPQQQWVDDSPLAQIPGFAAEDEAAPVDHTARAERAALLQRRLEAAGAHDVGSPEQVAEVDDAVRAQLLEGMDDAAVGAVAEWCNAYPAVEVSAAGAVQEVGERRIAAVQVDLSFLVFDDDDAEPTPFLTPQQRLANCPRFPGAPRRLCRYWVAVVAPGADGPDTIRAVKMVAPTRRTEPVALRFPAETDGDDLRRDYKVFVLCDSYRTQWAVPVALATAE